MSLINTKENIKEVNLIEISLLNEISILLEHILNISSAHKVDLDKEKELVRIEEYKRYDRSLIRETLKDPRLFTRENNKIYPKNLYQYNYEENVDTYENRFIKSILISLKKDIEESYKKKEREKLPFLKAGISYGNYGTYSLLTRFIDNSIKEDEELENKRTYLLSILRVINNLLKNEFFKRIKEEIFIEVYATNLLINDKDYSYAYNYFLKNKESSLKEKEDLSLSLINTLKTKNEDHILLFKARHIKVKINEFIYDLRYEDKLYLRVSYKDNTKELFKDYEIDFKVNLFVKKMIINFNSNNYYLDIYEDKDIYEIILSLVTLLPYKNDICPICKKELDNNDYCSNCNSSFYIISKKGKRFAWILNVFALNLEGESYEN